MRPSTKGLVICWTTATIGFVAWLAAVYFEAPGEVTRAILGVFAFAVMCQFPVILWGVEADCQYFRKLDRIKNKFLTERKE